MRRLPDLNPPPFGDVRDHGRPILSFAWNKEGAHRAAAHSHPRAHIIQPLSGTYWAASPEGNWLVPSGQALWIPPLVHHEVYSHGSVSARMIFVDQEHADALPARCGTVLVSPLLSQLIERAMEYGNDYPTDGPAVRLARVMLDELTRMEVAPLLVPTSKEPRLSRAMAQMIENPGRQDSIERLARGTGASARTLARLFRTETGMTFREWRARLRLVESIERLQRGATVSEVAFDLGYGGVSSFVYMFRRHMGTPPATYIACGAKAEGT
jgi:AraC-like DNA-binding protein